MPSAGPTVVRGWCAGCRPAGFPPGKERVERLMRENGIHARHKRRYKATTDSGHGLPVAANVLDRQFTPRAPNQEPLRDPRGGHGRGLRLHRGPLQSQAAPFPSRLPVASAVLGTLAHDRGRSEAGRMNPTGWKTKN